MVYITKVGLVEGDLFGSQFPCQSADTILGRFFDFDLSGLRVFAGFKSLQLR